MENVLKIRQQVVDPELCQRYAQFASSLDRWHFKIIYWIMFISNLLVLFMASWTYTRYFSLSKNLDTYANTS